MIAADAWLDALALDDDPPAASALAAPNRGPVTQAEIDAYLAALNALSLARHSARGYKFAPTTYSIDPGGRKFLRVIARQGPGPGSSAFLFIEAATGDLYKPAGWKGPERNFARGNIRDMRPESVTGGRYIG